MKRVSVISAVAMALLMLGAMSLLMLGVPLLTKDAAGGEKVQRMGDVDQVDALNHAFTAAISARDIRALDKIWADKRYATFIGPLSTTVVVGWDGVRKASGASTTLPIRPVASKLRTVLAGGLWARPATGDTQQAIAMKARRTRMGWRCEHWRNVRATSSYPNGG